MLPTWIVFLIPAFPLFGFLLTTFLVRREREAGILASAAVLLSFVATILSMVALANQPEGARINLTLYEWFAIGAFRIPFGVLFDQLTAVMALLVTGVGTLIHIYSIGYMHGNPRAARFFSYLNLFVFMMLVLIMANNMLLLFLGWEGVGLASLLLIGFYFDRASVEPGIVPAAASVKAFVMNRIGDAGVILAMLLIFATFGTLSFYGAEGQGQGFLDQAPGRAFESVAVGQLGTITLLGAIGLLLFIGVTGKSAQVPLFTWLPDAMAGPTPVSALIHAATMVTSGVYLIARNRSLFESIGDGWVGGLIVGVGLFTAIIGAFAAATQYDIKRVLAYSTVSQLGYMVVAVGMGATTAALFHLLTHGFFKALLFLAAGSVIHATHGIQDMRRMGGLRKQMPATFNAFLVGGAALAGFPLLAGFWSKDEIIAHAWFSDGNVLLGSLLIATSLLTAFYVGRQLALVFFGEQRDRSYQAHESPASMTTPLLLLVVLTALGGAINFPIGHALHTYLEPVLVEGLEEYTLGKGVLAVLVGLLSAGALYGGWFVYARAWNNRIRVAKADPLYHYTGAIWEGAETAWGFDWVYDNAIGQPYKRLAAWMGRVFDQQGIQGILVEGTGRAIGWLGGRFRQTQSGLIRNYVLVFFAGVLVLLGYFVYAVSVGV